MKKISLKSLLAVFLIMFVVGCGGKTTSLEGKVVDGKGQPLANVKVAAKMSQPIKGYEQFETTTGADGTFKFGKLFPTSEYQLILYSERWTKENKIKTNSGPEGQTKMLPEPVMIRFRYSKDRVVLDTKTNLMWAANNNGSNVNWANAKSYCENYRGGGYTDWRMPTYGELAGLFFNHSENTLVEDRGVIWTSETRGSEAARFSVSFSIPLWGEDQSFVGSNYRALPVRSGK